VNIFLGTSCRNSRVNPQKQKPHTQHGDCPALWSNTLVGRSIWDKNRPWSYILRRMAFSWFLLRQVNPVGQPRCIPLTRLAALIVSLHTPSSSDLNYESMIQLSQGNRQSRNHGCEPSTRIQQKISRPAMARRPVAFADSYIRWSPLVGVFAELFFPISIQVARRRQSL
jgi:hypothetical protein